MVDGGMRTALTVAALNGCKASPPGALETHAVNWVKHNITIGGRHDKNPFAATPESIADGRQAFTQYCSLCATDWTDRIPGCPLRTEYRRQCHCWFQANSSPTRTGSRSGLSNTCHRLVAWGSWRYMGSGKE